MKNVLITGATGGIGSELVKLYTSQKYFVLAFGTNAEKLNLLKINIKIISMNAHGYVFHLIVNKRNKI